MASARLTSTNTPFLSSGLPKESTHLDLAPDTDTAVVNPPTLPDLSSINPSNPLTILAYAASLQSPACPASISSPPPSCSPLSAPGAESVHDSPRSSVRGAASPPDIISTSPPEADGEHGLAVGVTPPCDVGVEGDETEQGEKKAVREEGDKLYFLLAAAEKIEARIVVAKAAEVVDRVVSRACTRCGVAPTAAAPTAGGVGGGGKRKRTKSRKVQEQEALALLDAPVRAPARVSAPLENESDDSMSTERKCSCFPSFPAILDAWTRCASTAERWKLVNQAEEAELDVDLVLWEAAAVVWEQKWEEEKKRFAARGNSGLRKRQRLS